MSQLIEQLRGEVVQDERTLALKRGVLANLEALYGGPAPATNGHVRRKRVAAGSLDDRILGAVAEGPQGLKEIVTAAKARKGDVKRAVEALVSAGHLTQHSGGRWRTYGRPA